MSMDHKVALLLHRWKVAGYMRVYIEYVTVRDRMGLSVASGILLFSPASAIDIYEQADDSETSHDTSHYSSQDCAEVHS